MENIEFIFNLPKNNLNFNFVLPAPVGYTSKVPVQYGKDGINGVDGKNGINGFNGVDGINGTNGINGKDGINQPIDSYIIMINNKLGDILNFIKMGRVPINILDCWHMAGQTLPYVDTQVCIKEPKLYISRKVKPLISKPHCEPVKPLISKPHCEPLMVINKYISKDTILEYILCERIIVTKGNNMYQTPIPDKTERLLTYQVFNKLTGQRLIYEGSDTMLNKYQNIWNRERFLQK